MNLVLDGARSLRYMCVYSTDAPNNSLEPIMKTTLGQRVVVACQLLP
jgi:hypothetical protein